MITGHKDVPGFDPGVNAFYFTNLLPSAPKLLLNVETDDYGAVEVRSCGCMLEELGFTTHLSDIRSFSKATGEGVTLLGTEMVRVLEEELPARFGGSPLDYQLLEEQDAQGFTRIILLVHPDVPLDSEEAVVDAVYSSLRESGGVSARWAEALWRQAGTLRVRREAPRYTARGKFLPLRVDASTFTAPKSAG
jgi:hypothetical protein